MKMLSPECATVYGHDRDRERLINGFEDLSLSDGPLRPGPFSLFFGDEKEKKTSDAFASFDRPMFSSWSLTGDDDDFRRGFLENSGWNVGTELEVGLSLEELAENHLQNHALERKISVTDRSGDVPATAATEKGEPEDLKAQEKQISSIVETEEMLPVKKPSPLGQVLCRKRNGKIAVCKETQRIDVSPREIKPFDFLSPSPDDIVRDSQKGQKRGIRK